MCHRHQWADYVQHADPIIRTIPATVRSQGITVSNLGLERGSEYESV